jgi:hypothetical protein
MDQNITVKLKKAEEKYKELKERLSRGEISVDQANAEVKQLMFQDDAGNYWNLGGKTGRWYKHINGQWQEADPYTELAPPVALEAEERMDLARVETETGTFLAGSESYEIHEQGELPYTDDEQPQQEEEEVGEEGNAFPDDEPAARKEQAGKTDYDYMDDFGEMDQLSQEEPVQQVEQVDEVGTVDYVDQTTRMDRLDQIDQLGQEEQEAPVEVEESGLIDSGRADQVDEDLFTSAGQSLGEDVQLETGSGREFLDAGPDSGGLETVDLETVGRDASNLDAGGLDEDFAKVEVSEYDLSEPVQDTGGLAGDSGFEATDSQLEEMDTNKFAIKNQEEFEDDSGSSGGVNLDFDIAGAEPAASAQPAVKDTFADSQELLVGEEPLTPQRPPAAGAAVDMSQHVPCIVCKSKIPPIAVYCSFCGANQKELDPKKALKAQKKRKKSMESENELVIKSIQITSFLFFLGGLGIIFGVILGGTFGVIREFLHGLSIYLPEMFKELRGGAVGGMIFAAIGGIGGFILAAILSLFLSGIYNLISFVFGGIRFKVKGQ